MTNSIQILYFKIDHFPNIHGMKNPCENPEYQNKVEKPLSDYGVYFYADYLILEFNEMVEIIKVKYSNQHLLPQEESIKKVLADSGNEMNPNPKSDLRN